MTDQPPSGLDARLKELGWAAWGITLVGSSSLTGALATLIEGPSAGDIDAAAVFIAAFFGGFALAVGVAIAWWALSSGKYQGYAAASVTAISLAAGIVVASAIGIGVVGEDAIREAADLSNASGPWGTVQTLLLACVLTYGPVASAQAAIAGWFLGHWANLIQKATA